MKRTDIDTFEKLHAQLNGLHQEMSQLAKKSAKDAVNTFKLKFINATLARCNTFLGDKYRPFQDFETFSTEDLPSNSDVTFIISQYLECAEKFRADNIHVEYGSWYWNLDKGEKGEAPPTAPPKKISD